MSKRQDFPFKLTDTNNTAPKGRVEQYWRGKAFEKVLGSKREGKRIPDGFKFLEPQKVVKYFNLRGIEFGNWINQEERFEYLSIGALGLYDLAKILNYPVKKMGLNGNISLAFGARGKSAALAHFEPATYAINLTKFQTERDKVRRQFLGGGMGSLGHEWSHALDHYVSEKNKFSYSWFITENVNRVVSHTSGGPKIKGQIPKNPLVKSAVELMMAIKYVDNKKGGISYSPYYEKLKAVIDKNPFLGQYWLRDVELFARAFEVHIFYEGKRKKIKNPALFKSKYAGWAYLDKQEYKRVRPYMVKFLNLAKKEL